MLNKIIYFSIHHKFIIAMLTLALVGWGAYSLTHLPIDALPDVTNNQVQVITTAPTLASQEIEQLVTFPIEQAVKTIPNIIELRSISRFGLSVVTIVFKENANIYWAREQIFQRLQQARENIPSYAGNPMLAPISTGLGEIYQYVVFAKKGYEERYSATELRAIQDWIITPQLQGIEGVAEVGTWGGALKQYEVAVQPQRLQNAGITISDIVEALNRSNQNTGGAYIENAEYAYFIRGVGMVKNLDDIARVVIKNVNGRPILIRDVATVQMGTALRYGATTKDGKGEIVGGITLMLKGENSSAVVSRVKERMEKINKTLPEGVTTAAFIDRTKLVNAAVSTVSKNLLEGALIVIFVLVLFLGNLRAGLIVASVIPLAMLFAVSLMRAFGISGNLMSLGAIDFGIIVDGAVIVVEATMHHLWQVGKRRGSGVLTREEMDIEVYDAASKIRSSSAFGEIIILIVYLPILALVGIEGKMFAPMALTVSFAVLGAFLLSLTYVPMMTALFLSKKTSHTPNISDRVMAKVEQFYTLSLTLSFKLQYFLVPLTLLVFAGAVWLFGRLGGEFIPTLEEGDLAIETRIMTGASLSQMIKTTTLIESRLREKFPEIETIVSKIGSGEIPTDPMPLENGDVVVVLKDKKLWRKEFNNWEDIGAAMKEEMTQIPGVFAEVSQPIQMRFNELMTGSRSDVAIKIFGDDLDILAAKAEELVKRIQHIEGVSGAKARKITGLPQITVRYDFDKIALYGLQIDALNSVLRASFAGDIAGTVIESGRRFDIAVRLAADARTDIAQISNLMIPLPSGAQLPLSQVATVAYEDGPVEVSREDGKRLISVGLNVRGKDIQTVVNDIQATLAKTDYKLPAGYYMTYGGQFQNLQAANARLSVAVPVALLLIFVLLFFTFMNIQQAILIFTAIPLSAIGGVLALWLRDMPFSISAGIGFIALFGVAVLNGIVLIAQFNDLKNAGMTDPYQRVIEGTKVRLRPVLMTAAVASLGFLPMALSNSGGAEVQKPLATVVIGGLITATMLTLIMLPLLYVLVEKWNLRRTRTTVSTMGIMLVAVLLSQNTYAQRLLTLPQARAEAQSRHYDLQLGQRELQRQSLYTATLQRWEPLQVQYMGGQFNAADIDHNITAQQLLPNRKWWQASQQWQTQQLVAQTTRNQLTGVEVDKQVTQAYYDYWYGWQKMKLQTRLLSIYDRFLQNANLRLQTGEGTALEALGAKTKVSLLQMEVQQSKLSTHTFHQALQLVLQTTDSLMIDTSALPRFDTALATAPERTRLQINLFEQEQAIRQQEFLVRKAQFRPRWSIGYFFQTIDRKWGYQGVLLGAQVPLTRKPLSGQQQLLTLEQSYTNLRIEQQQWQISRRQALYQTTLATHTAKLAYYENEGLPFAREMVRSAQRSFEAGEIDYLTYVNFLQQATSLELEYLETVRAYNEAAIAYHFIY